MRVIIKGADFSNVSIGKVTEDLSFRVCAASDSQEGVHGFLNYSEGQVAKSDTTYSLDNGTVISGKGSYRLITDYIDVVPGMVITFLEVKNPNASSTILPFVSCFDSSKALLTDASTYAAYQTSAIPPVNTNMPFTIPAGVSYIRIQMDVSNNGTANAIVGSMPE